MLMNKYIDKKQNIYFIGIGGCGMSSLALIFKKLNYKISGSDILTSKFTNLLKQNNIIVYKNHHKNNLKNIDLIVRSTAINDNNIEILEGKRLNIPIFHRSDALNYIISLHKNSIGILGTHGKGTITGCIIKCLLDNNYNVNYSIGGILIDYKNNYCIKNKKDYFITEVDESDGSFQKLKLDFILINNLSNDHMDYYKNFNNLVNTFANYINENNFKKIFLNLSDVGCCRLLNLIKNKNNVLSYGYSKNYKYYGKFIKLKKTYKISEKFSEFSYMNTILKTKLSAKFNINNLIGSLALCNYIGCDTKSLKIPIKKYSGVEDRFTTKFKDTNSYTKVYAHHPTEIKLIIDSFKNKENYKIIAIYEPFGSKKFFDDTEKELINCFKNSDEMIMLDYKNIKYKNNINIVEIFNKIIHKNKIMIPEYFKVYNYLNKFKSKTAFIFFGVPNKFNEYSILNMADDLLNNKFKSKIRNISDLIENLNVNTYGNNNKIISHLSDNSKNIKENSLFFGIKGKKFDGNNYIDEVISKGCKCIVSEIDPTRNDVSWIKTNNIRKTMSIISSRFYGNYKFKIIGVTGTNGKTSTCFITYTNLYKNGYNTLYIGSLGVYYNGKKIKSLIGRTTPNNLDIHKIFNDYLLADFVVMEVTSHALELYRVYDIKFEVVLLTNITQDHLDFHGSIENYTKAKLKIFKLNSKFKIINKKYKSLISENIKLFGDNYDSVLNTINGLELDVFYKNKIVKLKTPYYGDCYKENLLAFVSIIDCLNININKFYFPKIYGRMEKIANNPTVIVDFAHTPDAIENMIKSIKSVLNNKIAVIFGCGGDRDKNKRKLMGDIVRKYADKIYITSDNPRTEDPEEICKQIGNNYIVDREKAIMKSFELSKDWIILILGKGDEEYQIFKKKYYYSDVQIYNKIKTFYKKNILILGYGKSGKSVEKKIKKFNCNIDIYDDMKNKKQININDYDFIIVSPGIKPNHRYLKNKIVKYSEFEIGYKLHSNCKWVGITGTNGKSTTVSLLGMIYDNVVGNIGIPVSSLPDKIEYNDTIITEVSSFQLKYIDKFRPNICAILNITTDHMDYHNDFEDYKNTKMKISMNQKDTDFLLLPYDFKYIKDVKGLSKIIFFGKKIINKNCVYEENNNIILILDNIEKIIFKITNNKLIGYFNKLNIIVAGTIAYLDGKNSTIIEDAIEKFIPLEHRLEHFMNYNKIKFINNSVSTNYASCISSIQIYENPIILILGGLTKNNNPFVEIFKFVKKKSNIKKIICYGDAVNEIREINKKFNYDFLITFSNLEETINYTKEIAIDNDIILFSPACSSFDQYKSYKFRGNHFKNYCQEVFTNN